MTDNTDIIKSINAFYRFLEDIVSPLNMIPALLFIHDYQIRMFRKHTYRLEINGSEIHMWVLAYIAKEIARCASPILGYKELTMRDVLRIHREYYHNLDPLVDSELHFARLDNLAPLFLIWTTYEQLFWQEPLKNSLPRSLIIFQGDSSRNKDAIAHELSQIFYDSYGVHLDKYIFVGFCIWFMFTRNNAIDRISLFNTSISQYKSLLTHENIKNCLSIMTDTRTQFRNRCNRANTPHNPLRKYMLNELFLKPVILLEDLHYIAPVPRLILEKSTTGIYYLFLEIFNEEGKLEEFTKLFGQLFDKYVGKLLNTYEHRSATIHTADEFLPDNYRGKRCDWVICEDSDAIILIETKSTRIPRSIIESWDLKTFQSFIKERYLTSRGLEQLLETKEIVEEIRPNCKTILLIVVNDIFPFFNALRDFIGHSDSSIKKIVENRVQFMTIAELEYVIANSARFSLSYLISNKLVSPQKELEGFDAYFRGVPNFENRAQPDLLSDAFDTFFELQSIRGNRGH